ncbi:HlyD family secretion protein, partial [Citrobacter pasteurii]|uniref:HlyD family secretion protein n=2 Tax=Citrobacter TaxID=544 RepID=UPI00352FCC85
NHYRVTTGDILIQSSLCMTISTIATILLIIMLAIFVTFGEYTRKARLTGIVMPSSGLIKITPKFNGHVTKLTVKEGDHVEKGQLLYHISGEHYDRQGTGTFAIINQSLQAQYAMLTTQQNLEKLDNNQQQQAAKQRIPLISLQIKSAEHRLSLAKNQVELSSATVKRYQKLIKQKYVSDTEYQQKQIEETAAKENVENQRQLLLQLHTLLDTTKDNLSHLTLQGQSRNTELERQLQEIRKQQVEISSQENFALTAPVSGTVAAILVKQGQSVKAYEPALTLIPENTKLQIELYATSQNAGFIRANQKVSLRFQAFPYQKFGVQYGVIREISRTTLSPSDLLSITPLTWTVNEGHYRVIVEPKLSYILAYGKKETLRPGMLLEGDVSLDTRYLWEWLTEPIWSLKGKI